ncbi:sensor histidine kinase [Faecalicatena fissicatena]|uniref:histidine kinase n=1 Tax=Faecalicatena fissicatena TaxID=290055 RepID=A0ABS2E9K1_9FIRM|nr:sensor histidine kinase [Faecalicatena fissicatena]MBM6738311.1 sensor histidine kinase [Faecalicatena fissicatena]
MKQIRVTKIILVIETVLVFLLVGALGRIGYPPVTLFFLCVLQLMLDVVAFCAVIKPLKNLGETLDMFAGRDWTDEEFEERTESVPYIRQIREMMDRYAAQKTRENSAQIFDKQTELTALQSQINPHFLYNTLECIRGQALMDDNREIARMVEALAAFFRNSISKKGSLVTLRDEMANIDNYMLIQRYRFNNRFSMEIIIDEEDEEAYNFLIPRLIIQPVVENAIFHGLEERLEGGKVVIEVIVTEKNLIITISDNGKGIEKEKLKKLNEKIRSRDIKLEDGAGKDQRNTGIALPNIHKRIQLLYGEEYGVNVYSTPGQGTDVEITIPVNDGTDRGGENEERNIAD